MAHARCDVYQHMSVWKPMVIFTNAGVFRGHLPKSWKMICSDLPMAPFAVSSIDHKGYWSAGWSDKDVQAAIGELKVQ